MSGICFYIFIHFCIFIYYMFLCFIYHILHIYINYKLIVSPCSARLEIKAQRNWVIYPLWMWQLSQRGWIRTCIHIYLTLKSMFLDITPWKPSQLTEGWRKNISFKYPGHHELESLGPLSIQDRSNTVTAVTVSPLGIMCHLFLRNIWYLSAIVYITGFLWVSIISIPGLSQG